MNKKILSMLILTISMSCLTACAQALQDTQIPVATPTSPESPAAPAVTTQAQPTPTLTVAPPSPGEEILITEHSQARDAAVAHVAQVHGLALPTSWESEDLNPGNRLGSTAYRYTSGHWVVQVSAPVVALENVIFTVIIDYFKAGVHWEGAVNAYGSMAEGEVASPAVTGVAAVSGPESARDAAILFIAQNIGTKTPDKWVNKEVPQTRIDVTRFVYTSGGWVVNVLEPAAPRCCQFI